MTGSEIEAVFVESLYQAFEEDKEPTVLTIAQVLTEFVPLSKTMAEQITGLRSWAKGRARFATTPTAETKFRRWWRELNTEAHCTGGLRFRYWQRRPDRNLAAKWQRHWRNPQAEAITRIFPVRLQSDDEELSYDLARVRVGFNTTLGFCYWPEATCIVYSDVCVKGC